MTTFNRAVERLKSRRTVVRLYLPVAIFSFAFLFRFLYIFELRHEIYFNCFYVDIEYYQNWAQKILRGDLIGKDTFEMTPFYAYLLAFFYKFITDDLFLIRLFQICIGSFSCVLAYSIARKFLDSSVLGMIAGLISAFYGPFIFFDGMIMKTFLTIFFVLAMTVFLIKSESGHAMFSLMAGICLGVNSLVRENIILLIPIIPLWLFFYARHSERSSMRCMIAFLIGVFVIIMPVTIRNYYVGQEFVLITGGGGQVFYIGNNPEADGAYRPPDFTRMTPKFEHVDFRMKARQLAGKNLTRKESSDFWFGQGMRFITENPGQFMKLLFRKFLLFWNFYEFPDNQNYYFQKQQSYLLGGPVLNFALVAPLGFMGMLVSLRQAGKFAILHLTFLTYMGSVLLFFVNARYRLPATPFLIIFAVLMIWRCIDAVTSRKYRLLCLFYMPMLTSLYIMTNYNIFNQDPYSYNFDVAYANMAGCYAQAGETEQAEALFKKSLDINPKHANALLGLGNIWFQKGQLHDALDAYTDAINVYPNTGPAYNGQGNVLLAFERIDAAISAYRKAVALEPENPGFLTNLGFALNRKGHYAEALNQHESALRIASDFANAYYGLAQVYENLGRYADAAVNWKRFIQLSDQDVWKVKAQDRLDRLLPHTTP